MENSILINLANLLDVAENDEKQAYINGIFNGARLDIDLHIKIVDKELKSLTIGKASYVSKNA